MDVNVQYQQWTQHLAKFDATLAGGNAPDVIEMGNTEMRTYMAPGAFQDLTSSRGSFDNSANWLSGMVSWGPYSGKLYGIPYYAGSPVVTYRTDLFKKAGIKSVRRACAVHPRRQEARRDEQAEVLLAGLHRRARLVHRDELRVRQRRNDRQDLKGKWVGTLTSRPRSPALTAWKSFWTAGSRASKTADEAHPFPYDGLRPGAAARCRAPRG